MLLPLVLVVPTGLSRVTPDGSVSVNVAVWLLPLVFVNANPTASEVFRLIGLFSKLVLIVAVEAAIAADAPSVAVISSAAAAAKPRPVKRRFAANPCAISLKTKSP